MMATLQCQFSIPNNDFLQHSNWNTKELKIGKINRASYSAFPSRVEALIMPRPNSNTRTQSINLRQVSKGVY